MLLFEKMIRHEIGLVCHIVIVARLDDAEI